MSNSFKGMRNLFTYKPTEYQTFELLEDDNEGIEQASEEIPTKPGNAGQGSEPEKSSGGKCQIQQANGRVSSDLDENMNTLTSRFNLPKNQNIIIREFNVARKIRAFLIFVDGMVQKTVINESLLPGLMKPENFNELREESPLDYIMKNVISVDIITKMEEFKSISLQILNGMTALFVEGCNQCLIIESKGFEKRNIDAPLTEAVIRGPQEGFTEDIRVNITLIRKIIKNENLIAEVIQVGKTNRINIGILYLQGVANEEVIKEVKRRLNSIDVDFTTGNGMVGQLIEDHPFMLFPQIISTERPDRTASFIMEGQVVIIDDGTPFADALPVTFFTFFHTSEESHLRWQYGMLLRFIRLIGIFVVMFLPGLYVALTLYHQEMIPTALMDSIAKARENTPFPVIIEILVMEGAFELIREGSIRVPGVIGQTLGIIGALILGQTAVAADLVSSILIIIVSITALGSFAVPSYELALALRIIKFVFIFFGAIAGFYGLSVGIFIMGGLICSMKSFGVPFLSPVAPKTKSNSDTLLSYPIWMQKMRPDYNNTPNRNRQAKKTRGWIKKNKGDNNK